MKILITGFNKNQCTEGFYLQQQLKVVPSHYSLVRCLRDMGHTVDQKMLSFDEDTSEYDKVICFLASPGQPIQMALYNTAKMLAETPKHKLIFAYDDWQVRTLYKDVRRFNKSDKAIDNEFLMTQRIDKSLTNEIVLKHEATIRKGIDISVSTDVPILLSCFAGGDTNLFLKDIYAPENIFTYNPNPYHRNRKPGDYGHVEFDELDPIEQLTLNSAKEDTVPAEQKERCFNFSSLLQSQTKTWIKKQNAKVWPIKFYGKRGDSQQRMTEDQMCRIYAKQWGCLMPGYHHSGSGWWRARPLQLADAGSILIGHPDELNIYYHDNALSSITAHDIECMDLSELIDVAAKQKEALYKNHPLDKSVQQAELQAALNA